MTAANDTPAAEAARLLEYGQRRTIRRVQRRLNAALNALEYAADGGPAAEVRAALLDAEDACERALLADRAHRLAARTNGPAAMRAALARRGDGCSAPAAEDGGAGATKRS